MLTIRGLIVKTILIYANENLSHYVIVHFAKVAQ